MNCKQKAILTGIGFGTALLLALSALMSILIGLFMLGERIGVDIAGIMGIIGLGVIVIGASKMGYQNYLETHCKEE